MKKMHCQFGYLTFETLKNVVESRAWWPSMDRDVEKLVEACSNCQTHHQRLNQEKK